MFFKKFAFVDESSVYNGSIPSKKMANIPKILSDLAIIVVRVWSCFGLHSLVSILACAVAQH
jgi:hypothetical protein